MNCLLAILAACAIEGCVIKGETVQWCWSTEAGTWIGASSFEPEVPVCVERASYDYCYGYKFFGRDTIHQSVSTADLLMVIEP